MKQTKQELITKQRQRQIMDAAFDVFSRKGFAEATTHEIAREAGVAVGTIYKYFQNKRDLMVAVVTDIAITEPFLQILEKHEDTDDSTFVRSIISDRLNFGMDNAEKMIPFLSEILRDDELSRRFADTVFLPNIGLGQKYLEAKSDAGVFRVINAQVVIRCFIGMMIGFMMVYRLEGTRSPINSIPRDEVISNMSDLILHGLQTEKD
jgi:AcrR family transcriptional regulator